MRLIKENGAPRKTTKGYVGDTYIDLETGKNYRCVSVIQVSLGESEYDWQYISTTDIPEQKSAPYEEEIPEETPEADNTEVLPEQKTVEHVVQNREWPRDNNRKPYNKQYNKHYNQNRN